LINRCGFLGAETCSAIFSSPDTLAWECVASLFGFLVFTAELVFGIAGLARGAKTAMPNTSAIVNANLPKPGKNITHRKR